MRFSIKGVLAAIFVHSASWRLGVFNPEAPHIILASAWAVGPLLTHRQPSRVQLSLVPENQETDAALYTSADIAETIRHESEMEMKKVSDLSFRSFRPPSLIQTKDELASYLSTNQIHNYLFDCDGVLYRGTDSMPEASGAIQYLLNSGQRVFFVTNNAASSRMELKQKLEKVLNLPKDTLKEDMMIGSAYVASRYLHSRLSNANTTSQKVHVIGTSGLCQELQSAGFEVSGGPDPIGTPSGMSRDELASYPFPEGEIDAMVIGLDNDFNYRKLCIATVLLQHNPHAILVATNRDSYDLVGYDARHLPGNGAVVSSVEAASGRAAINVGKPSPVLANWIMEEYSLNKDETMMIGDRLDTDVKFGNTSGMKSSALVMTGCTTANEIEQLVVEDGGNAGMEERQEMIPSVIFPHVGYMSSALE